MRGVSEYDKALRGNYEERGSMRKVDLYFKMLKKRNGMCKRTLVCENVLDVSGYNDDFDDNSNNNVKWTESSRGTGCDYNDMQSRQMNGNREYSLKLVSLDLAK
jgi:hypothetical protein